MFSKELQELDRNTVEYMIDEMQLTINQLKEELEQQKNAAEQQKLCDQKRIEELEMLLANATKK